MCVCNSMNSIQTIKSARNDFTSRYQTQPSSTPFPSPRYTKMKPEITNYFWFTHSLARIRWITCHFTRNIIGLSMGLGIQWHIFGSYTVRHIRHIYNDMISTCVQSNGKLFSLFLKSQRTRKIQRVLLTGAVMQFFHYKPFHLIHSSLIIVVLKTLPNN